MALGSQLGVGMGGMDKKGSTLAVVKSPNTTGFSVLASEILLVTSHFDYQNYGGKFLCQL